MAWSSSGPLQSLIYFIPFLTSFLQFKSTRQWRHFVLCSCRWRLLILDSGSLLSIQNLKHNKRVLNDSFVQVFTNTLPNVYALKRNNVLPCCFTVPLYAKFSSYYLYKTCWKVYTVKYYASTLKFEKQIDLNVFACGAENWPLLDSSQKGRFSDRLVLGVAKCLYKPRLIFFFASNRFVCFIRRLLTCVT